jgi:RNA polymerase sigma-70 factor (ECF subfamily)
MWPDASQTQELLAGAAQGQPAAIDRLLARHRDALRRLVELRLDRAVRQRVDASDVVQEALVEAARRLKDYLADPKLPFHLWLRQIAKDRLVDAHRRHRGAARRSLDRQRSLDVRFADQSSLDLAAQVKDAQLTPAAAAMRQELAARFESAMERLDETDREVIAMRHLEQLSNQEVAQALGLSEPAAGMRYLRAMRRLRPLLDDGAAGRNL